MKDRWKLAGVCGMLMAGLVLMISADALIGTNSFAAQKPAAQDVRTVFDRPQVTAGSEERQVPAWTAASVFASREEEPVQAEEAAEAVTEAATEETTPETAKTQEETAEEPETEEVTTIFASTMMEDTQNIQYDNYDVDAPAKTYEQEQKEIVDAVQARKWNNMIISTASVLNIREKASTDAKIIGKLPKYGGGTILDYNKDKSWVKIKSGPVTGWVSMDYVISGDKVAATAEKVGTEKVIVLAETLRAREEANTESKIVALLDEGEEFEILKKGDGWAKIAVDDDEAWINTDYVTISYELEKAVVYHEPEPVKETKKESSSDSSKGSSGGSKSSSKRSSMVAYAMKFLGNRYVWGGTSLTKGTDCSGFTMRIYEHFGYDIPRTSYNQAKGGKTIKISSLKPGDLVFYSNSSGINHVAMYIGNGQVIHASNARSGIKISNINYRTPTKAVRYIND
ncbi:MAG: C40 family peptidase [Lachnospiraceae bacterium]|nr:C40 family peptidase [Lachnospiraceae bacterium]